MMKPMKTHIFTVTSSSKAATIYRNLPLSSWPLGPWEIPRCIENFSTEIVQVTPGWWLTYPSDRMWVRQLGWWHSQYMESHKIHVPNHQPVLYDDLTSKNGVLMGISWGFDGIFMGYSDIVPSGVINQSILLMTWHIWYIHTYIYIHIYCLYNQITIIFPLWLVYI